jgi:hypothetical protein
MEDWILVLRCQESVRSFPELRYIAATRWALSPFVALFLLLTFQFALKFFVRDGFADQS